MSDLIADDAIGYLRTRGHAEDVVMDAETFAHFRELGRKLPPGGGIVFVDARGVEVLHFDEFPTVPVDLYGRDWFQV